MQCEPVPWSERPQPPRCTQHWGRHGSPLLAPRRALFTPVSVSFLDVFGVNYCFREREKVGALGIAVLAGENPSWHQLYEVWGVRKCPDGCLSSEQGPALAAPSSEIWPQLLQKEETIPHCP